MQVSYNYFQHMNFEKILSKFHLFVFMYLVFQWFVANFTYQEALDDTQMAIVNTLSSTSGKKQKFQGRCLRCQFAFGHS